MGCEFEEHVVNVPAGEHKSEAYLKINPAGQVPCLVDGDMCLAESRAILVYLALKTKSDLYPASPKARAEIDQAMFWDMDFWPKVVKVIVPGLFKGDEEAMMAGLLDVVPGIDQLNSMISKEGWVCGAKCTLADISIQGTISGLKVLAKFGKNFTEELKFSEKNGIMAWHGNMQKLQGWKDLFEVQLNAALGLPSE